MNKNYIVSVTIWKDGRVSILRKDGIGRIGKTREYNKGFTYIWMLNMRYLCYTKCKKLQEHFWYDTYIFQ